MQLTQKNSIKTNFYRLMAVIITLCYVLGPAQLPIKTILHTISHNLEIPSYVLQHNNLDNSNYVKDLSLGEHKDVKQLNHKHQVIDLLDLVFNQETNKNKNQRGEPTQLDTKIKKHITSKAYTLVFHNNQQIDQPIFWKIDVCPKIGYLDQLYRPPQV